MRFREFFIEYRMGLRKIDRPASFKRWSLHEKIAMIFVAVMTAISIPFIYLRNPVGYAIFAIGLMTYIIYSIVDICMNNKEKTLGEYKDYSFKRISMLHNLLCKYSISVTADKIDELIKEAEITRNRYNSSETVKSVVKKMYKTICPILVILYETTCRIGDSYILVAQYTFIGIMLYIIVYFFVKVIISTFHTFIHPDYEYYDDLIYDLRQIKIFETNIPN